MPQAVWTGHLSFGLVNIPVKLYSATAPRDVRFHQYESGTGRRIRYQRVATGPAPEHPASPPEELEPEPPAPREPPQASQDQGEVPWEKIVKGFEVEPGRVVTVTPEELLSVAPPRSRELEVEQFVDLREIDPVYFEKTYYLVPQGGVGAERPYWLLYRAMEAAARVAVGRFVMRTKEYLAAVRPGEHVLVLETLLYADEVRDPKQVWVAPVEEPPDRELEVAHQFVDALAGSWEPARHRDEHRERVLDLLRSKAEEAYVVEEPDEQIATPPAIDLLEALEASVEAARRARRDEQRGTG
jgi:DNA end-binding protein Ku